MYEPDDRYPLKEAYYFDYDDYKRVGVKRYKRVIALKPCPLCGGKPRLDTYKPDDTCEYVTVACEKCGLKTLRFWKRKNSITLAVSDAMEYWNNRVDERPENCRNCRMICPSEFNNGKTAKYIRCDKYKPMAICINCKHYSSMRCLIYKKHINEPEWIEPCCEQFERKGVDNE